MSDPTGTSPFAAPDPALGYLYQVRYALFESLCQLRNDIAFLVSIETLDDVAFESTVGNPTELLQTKHHRRDTASLSDASPDVWKTLRIWFEGSRSGDIPSTARLFLISTGVAAAESASFRLRATGRDTEAAQRLLDATASSSTNQQNKRAYEAYLRAPSKDRRSILDRIVIIDAAPSVVDLDDELRQEVYWAVNKAHHTPFLEKLEGWWFRRVLQQLAAPPCDRIGSVELEAKMADLRDQFRQDALPIDDDLLEFILDDATSAAHEGSTFVRQLEIIKAGKRRIAAAIRDYYRAFEQRSRWLRDDLVVGIDLHKYEKRLIEEWELVFEAMRDDLGDPAAAAAKERSARSVLAWAERTSIPIRPNVTEPFVTRGSLHLLSDEIRIGWHPDFRDRLATLLNTRGEAK